MKKFLYKDSSTNRQSEYESYDLDDFVSAYSVSSANKPVKTSVDGKIDPSLVPSSPASSVQLSKIASEDIVSGECVAAVNDTDVKLADYSGTLDDALVFGVAMSSATTGQPVNIMILGLLYDSGYSVFPVNSVLYLDVAGTITDTRQTTGYLTSIGKSLGSGYVMVQIGLPSKLS